MLALCHSGFDVGVAGSALVLLSCMSLLVKQCDSLAVFPCMSLLVEQCDSGQGLGLIGSLLLP